MSVDRQTLTAKEVSEYIGVSIDMIYKMVRENSIPYIPVGNRKLFRRESIDQWLMEKEATVTDTKETSEINLSIF
ncbi:helix-turn-helix domain-containing protein [Natribacillus halophilus]|uniref:DNA binding domain-containing protein, excisionase family n=1 Tax=Natribacillus halophilus TaxID=549003 RepID=A0A1G8KII2_9BACI|nr:helix-turn-helix domain-containing protein [Natribacillus halophilus]SDI43176.1 DNA binding domain-containing protein, excisionase family [Natribacillus halophilus]